MNSAAMHSLGNRDDHSLGLHRDLHDIPLSRHERTSLQLARAAKAAQLCLGSWGPLEQAVSSEQVGR